MGCNLRFGRVQLSIFRWLHTFQTASGLVSAVYNYSTTQKHFDWAVQVLLAY